MYAITYSDAYREYKIKVFFTRLSIDIVPAYALFTDLKILIYFILCLLFLKQIVLATLAFIIFGII